MMKLTIYNFGVSLQLMRKLALNTNGDISTNTCWVYFVGRCSPFHQHIVWNVWAVCFITFIQVNSRLSIPIKSDISML